MPDVLPTLLKKRGLTQRAFAQLVGKSESTISMIVSEKRRPSDKYAERWASELGLTGTEREIFIDAVHLSAASPRVRAMVARLERENKRLRKRLHQ